jgi:hypothetical protein
MMVHCEKCALAYDDADRMTFCPHDLIMPAADLAQKKAGLALLERDICFAHMPAGPVHRVQSVSWNGMVTLRDMAGEFAPHLFVQADGSSAEQRLIEHQTGAASHTTGIVPSL